MIHTSHRRAARCSVRFIILGLCAVWLSAATVSCTTASLFDSAYGDYPDFARVRLFLRRLAAAYPELVTLETLGHTAGGRAITAVHIDARRQRKPDKPQLLFTAIIHGDEWVSLPAMLYTIHALVSRYDHDREIHAILDNTSLWFVPVVNPDGYEYSRQNNRDWRKNRAVYGEKAVGVDINRNFDYRWNAPGGFSRDPDSRFYMGPAPSSEAETRALQTLAQRIRFTAAIDFHSFGRYILYPYGYTRKSTVQQGLFHRAAQDMAAEIKSDGGADYTPLQLSSIYPEGLPTGTLMDYLYGRYETLAFTLELSPKNKEQGGVSPSRKELPRICSEALSAVRCLCNLTFNHFK